MKNALWIFFPKPPQVWLFEPEKVKTHFMEEQSKLEKEQTFFMKENIFLKWERLETGSDQEKKERGAFSSCPLIKLRGCFSQSLFSESKETLLLDQSPCLFLTENFSSSVFKKSKTIKEDLENLPVSDIIFTGSRLEELKKLLFKENILSSTSIDFFQGKNLIFLSGQMRESFFLRGRQRLFADRGFGTKKTGESQSF